MELQAIKKNLFYFLRVWLGNYRPLSYVFEFHPYLRKTLLRRNAVVCIEGFPRSGNTFFVRYFCSINKVPNLGHHLHVTSQIQKAIKFNVPCVVLYREPIEAIASLLVMDERLSIDLATWSYVNFYSRVKKYNQYVVLSNFKDVTTSPDLIITKINGKYKTQFNTALDPEKQKKHILKGIANPKAIGYSEKLVSSPNEFKTNRKLVLYPKIQAGRFYSKAQAVYEEILRLDA